MKVILKNLGQSLIRLRWDSGLSVFYFLCQSDIKGNNVEKIKKIMRWKLKDYFGIQTDSVSKVSTRVIIGFQMPTQTLCTHSYL